MGRDCRWIVGWSTFCSGFERCFRQEISGRHTRFKAARNLPPRPSGRLARGILQSSNRQTQLGLCGPNLRWGSLGLAQPATPFRPGLRSDEERTTLGRFPDNGNRDWRRHSENSSGSILAQPQFLGGKDASLSSFPRHGGLFQSWRWGRCGKVLRRFYGQTDGDPSATSAWG